MNEAPYAISPRDSVSGLPCSAVMSCARSSWFAIIRSNHLRRITARSFAVFARHAGHARSAASTARFASAPPMRGTVPSTAPVAGLCTAMVFRSPASAQPPSM